MKKAIIHLSDLHFFAHKTQKDELVINDKLKSWLTTNPTDKFSEEYINNWLSYIKNKYSQFKLYLLISGDIANQSEELEYNSALIFLEKISDSLKIAKDKILIVPGDHDINRFACQRAFQDGKSLVPNKKAYEYQEKYVHFSKFYQDFYGSIFDSKTNVINKLVLPEEKILILGLNSNFKIDYEGGEGSFDLNNLDTELSKVCKEFADYSKCAMFHHNLYANFEDKAIGQWNKENRIEVLKSFKKFDFKCLFYGNEHTRSSSKGKNQIYYSDCGSFGMKDPTPSFKIYEIYSSEIKLALPLRLFVLQNAHKNSEYDSGNWGIQDNGDMEEEQEIILYTKNETRIEGDDTIDNLTNAEVAEEKLIAEVFTTEKLVSDLYTNQEFKSKLFEIVKKHRLYHSGHFHWSNDSRAHNWIDSSKLLNNKEDLEVVKESIIDLIDECKLYKVDFIIGLGIEGNILATNAMLKYEKPYSFLPYSYRYDDHNEYEKRLNYKNTGRYKTVLIVTDVVNEGRTLRKLINDREKVFFKKVKKIIVVSLFYAGNKKIKSISLLNNDKDSKKLENDHIENRIDYYYILHLQVEKCPYFNDFRENCIYFKEKLGPVHKFYDDTKTVTKLP